MSKWKLVSDSVNYAIQDEKTLLICRLVWPMHLPYGEAEKEVSRRGALIEAAPEMLEALEEVFEKLKITNSPLLPQIEAIIKKAKGE